MRNRPKSIAEIEPCDNEISLVMFGLFNGCMEDMGMFLNAAESREELLLFW